MEKIIILEFGAQNIHVHIYNVNEYTDVDWDYIQSLGFNPDDCIWYFATNINILNHKETLK